MRPIPPVLPRFPVVGARGVSGALTPGQPAGSAASEPELATWPMLRLNRGATLPRIGAVEAVGNE